MLFSDLKPKPKPKQKSFFMEQTSCNYTDEEIAQSFIEDVEAVIDLLPKDKE